MGASKSPRAAYFNPRSPHGERLLHLLDFFPNHSISTHAPRTGSDYPPRPFVEIAKISTHAPRTGSDTSRTLNITILLRYFNPRSPHGERP